MLEKPSAYFAEHLDFNNYGFRRNQWAVWTDHPEFLEYEGKSILLVCGGGTARGVTEDMLRRYDYVWSMNHFFKHELLKDYPIDLCMINAEVLNFSLKGLKSYLARFNPLVGFEHARSLTSRRKIIKSIHNNPRKFCMHTSLYNQTGYGTRMIIFAGVLKAHRVDFIGMDGAQAILNKDHAFQPNKNRLPGGGNVNRSNAHSVFLRQYDTTWKYIRTHFPALEIENLAYDDNVYHRGLQ